jgi:hypothetical protein
MNVTSVYYYDQVARISCSNGRTYTVQQSIWIEEWDKINEIIGSAASNEDIDDTTIHKLILTGDAIDIIPDALFFDPYTDSEFREYS